MPTKTFSSVTIYMVFSSHNEEIRILKASNKSIKVQLKECNEKLKERENELEALRESHNKLKKLSNNKNLPEREKLQKKLDELREIVREQEDKIQVQNGNPWDGSPKII